MKRPPVADTDEPEIIEELEAMKEWDNNFDIWAVVTGDYSEFESPYKAEASLAYALHFNWSKQSVVARALEVINENWERNDGLPRLWSEKPEWYWNLMSLDPGKEKKEPYEDINRWRRNRTREQIEAAFWEEFDSGGGHEIYAFPGDIASNESVDVDTMEAVTYHLEKMNSYTKVKDPNHSGRGRPKKVFAMDPDRLD